MAIISGDKIGASGGSGNSSSSLALTGYYDKFTAQNFKPAGWNYYSLLSDILYNMPNNATVRPQLLSYIQGTEANLVRVAFPCFTSGEYLTQVHNTGTMPSAVSDANLKTTWVNAVDTVMNALANYGLKAYVCTFWSQASIPTAFGESEVTAYGNTNSQTSQYCKSWVSWFVNKYKDHAAFGLLSFGNEWLTDDAGVAHPTPAQLGAWYKSVADVARVIKPSLIVTASLTCPTLNIQVSRETLDQAIIRYRTVFKYLDCYSLHLYSDMCNYVSRCSAENGNTGNVYYAYVGYEGAPTLMETLSAMAKSDNKPLIISEFGVSRNNEWFDPADGGKGTFTSNKKSWRFAKAVLPNCDVGLVWNVQNTAHAASSGDQSIWCCDPQAVTDLKATYWGDIVKYFNRGKPEPKAIAGGSYSLKKMLEPRFAIHCSGRGAGENLRFTSTAAHQSSTGYTFMCWIKQHTLLFNNAEVLADFRGAGSTSGFFMLAGLYANNNEFYIDGRYASGSSGNNYQTVPPVSMNDWVHYAVEMRNINMNGTNYPVITTWLNGIYWKTTSVSSIPAAIPVGTTCYGMGNASNGVALRMQDIALYPQVSQEEIWAHMRGEVSPNAMLFVRAFEDGTIKDISKNSTALTMNGISVRYE